MKKPSLSWSLLIGLLAVVAQALTYLVRFGQWNRLATFAEYLSFFLSGVLGGLILVFFLNRQASAARRWIVLAAFLLASPFALIFMLAGGLFGPLGVLIFPLFPWALFMGLGALVGRLVERG